MKAVNKIEVLDELKQLAAEEYIDEDDVPPIERAIKQMKEYSVTLEGHWNKKDDFFVCSKCGNLVPIETHFCSVCGSCMKESYK